MSDDLKKLEGKIWDELLGIFLCEPLPDTWDEMTDEGMDDWFVENAWEPAMILGIGEVFGQVDYATINVMKVIGDLHQDPVDQAAAEQGQTDMQAIYADFQGRMVRAGHDQAISVLDECFRDHLIDQNEEVRV
jgi:hypothetical protein